LNRRPALYESAALPLSYRGVALRCGQRMYAATLGTSRTYAA
jgi:hypothetical protein